MSIGYWEVVALDEAMTRFACQRTPIFSDAEFETVEPFNSQAAAEVVCEELNEDVADELAALPDHLR